MVTHPARVINMRDRCKKRPFLQDCKCNSQSVAHNHTVCKVKLKKRIQFEFFYFLPKIIPPFFGTEPQPLANDHFSLHLSHLKT
jgi:hypothetical protein